MIANPGHERDEHRQAQVLHPLHQHMLDRIGHPADNTCPDCPVTGLPVDPSVGFITKRCTTPSGRTRRIRIGFADQQARDEFDRDPDYYAAIALDDLFALEASHHARSPRPHLITPHTPSVAPVDLQTCSRLPRSERGRTKPPQTTP